MYITVQQLAEKINNLERFKPQELKPEKTPVIYVNCSKYPFIEQIQNLEKLFETRNKNTLKKFVGKSVLLAETGKGKKPIVRCSVTISDCIRIDSENDFDKYRKQTCIVNGSVYDWKPDTKQKYLYKLTDVKPVPSFVPEGVRHGRIWMECTINN